ncbi:hypothetical protein RSAG8_03697, partial [Rhizoctonia solani AG-8 WAC10335]
NCPFLCVVWPQYLSLLQDTNAPYLLVHRRRVISHILATHSTKSSAVVIHRRVSSQLPTCYLAETTCLMRCRISSWHNAWMPLCFIPEEAL